MEDKKNHILNEIASYYSSKLAQHGETPRGVDWNGSASQLLRFEQLCKIIQPTSFFSLTDIGCGYGALLDFLTNQGMVFSYTGLDISKDMIQSAQKKCRYSSDEVRFLVANEPDRIADYSVASGIFNVRLDHSDSEWEEYVKATIGILDSSSYKGFAFNCLTSYSDTEKMQNYLWYADPCYIFDLCKRHYSRNVALLHDYGLYEFTILVRKSL